MGRKRNRFDPERAGIWALVTRPETGELPRYTGALAAGAARLTELASPALAGYLLQPGATRMGKRLITSEFVKQSRLRNRFNRSHQVHWARVIAEAGIEVVYIKGFANAHLLYPDPDLRTVGDLDVLVRKRDFDGLVAMLSSHGFQFGEPRLQPWGFISEASFAPFVSPDGACNIDLHIHPDSYPVYLSLDTESVFAASRMVEAEGVSFRVPCPEHSLVLAVSNAAKDKFGPFSILKVLDAIMLLRSHQALDWEAIEEIARYGRFLRPMRVFLSLLVDLGLPREGLPASLVRRPRLVGRREFARLTADYRALFPQQPGAGALWRRELLLCTQPWVGLYNTWLRLRGMVRPRSGIPAVPGP